MAQQDEWHLPTLAEAYLGLDDWDAVERNVNAFVAKPDAKAPDVKAPDAKAPDSKAPDSKAPDSKAPEPIPTPR